MKSHNSRTSWSTWQNLKSLSEQGFKNVPLCPGAYKIAAGRGITRAVGKDKTGVLTIGQSSNLRSRLKQFWRSAGLRGIRVESGNHMAGYRYAKFNFRGHYPIDSLLVQWKESKEATDAKKLEGHELNKYLRRHMELPPLNYSFNWFKA